MPDPIEANYIPDGDDWQVTVVGRGQRMTGKAPGLIAARDRADQLVEKVAPNEEHRTVVHLLNGDALQFTTAYLTARLAKPAPAPAPVPSPPATPSPSPRPAAAKKDEPAKSNAESVVDAAAGAAAAKPKAPQAALPAPPAQTPAPRGDSEEAAKAGAKQGAGPSTS